MIQVHAFHPITGRHIAQIPYSRLDWADSLNESGSMNLTMPLTLPELSERTRSLLLREYGIIYGAFEVMESGGIRFYHAGYLKRVTLADDHQSWTLSVGGGGTILSKRLVLNYGLRDGWRDGQVLIDEDNPPGNWVFKSTGGSYADVFHDLIVETLKWGSLPLQPNVRVGGSRRDLTWNCWELKTVSTALSDIGEYADGPEFRWQPRLDEQWNLNFWLQVSSDSGELVDHTWTWNTAIPGDSVSLEAVDSEGAGMVGASYAVGGRDEDKILIAHHVGSALTSQGWPLLQAANVEHGTVSVLSTLQNYARADVQSGDQPQRSAKVTCSRTYNVHVGDWVNLRDNSVLHELKVTDISGDASKDTLSLDCSYRY